MRHWRTLFFVQFDENFSLDKLAQMCYNWPADAGRFGRNFGFVKYLENFSAICSIIKHSSVFPEWTLCAGRARVRRPVFPPYTAPYGIFLLLLAALYARQISRKCDPLLICANGANNFKINFVKLTNQKKKKFDGCFVGIKNVPPEYYNIFFI